LIAIEIKHAKEIQPKMLHGLKAFKTDYPVSTCYLLYLGDQPRYLGDITALPFVEGLKKITEWI
jgi:hypothetical protein